MSYTKRKKIYFYHTAQFHTATSVHILSSKRHLIDQTSIRVYLFIHFICYYYLPILTMMDVIFMWINMDCNQSSDYIL